MLDEALVAQVLGAAQRGGADFAELFVEDRVNTALRLHQGELRDARDGNLFGAGVRLLYGTQVVYAYTNDVTATGLLELARQVAQARGDAGVTDAGGAGGLDFRRVDVTPMQVAREHPLHAAKARKLALMRRAHAAAAGVGAVRTVDVTYLDMVQRVLIANSEGLWAEDERLSTRIACTAIAQEGTDRATGSSNPGAGRGLEFFEERPPEEIGAEAARIANAMLGAAYAPAGKYPVVIGNAFGGVIFHEACGHILETTAVEKNASVFAGKIGQRIAHDCVTAVDDGTIPGAWGALGVDDEGMVPQRTTLIERGVLKSYMVDRVGHLKTGEARTGSGRRASYRYAPASRMRSTFIDAGDRTPEELIRGVQHGIYARTMGGGSVTPGTGDYNFAVNEAYMIRGGEVAEPLRGAALVGNGAQDLMNIVGVAGDLHLGQGMCGSVSGSLPTDVGQPHILISEITVGGRA
ncbi:TldD/PmbA family protein [Deinococcus soli (ex Cha et al. 2016)]|jgi:TldD protein|uniref:TldD/PmbA family protein n=1 Tax=Deinococcus soli (ex Cha et al. 2016) TaxID=1309411 RepID=UPI00166D47C1|nr:TldD/PmbA family protein [Deinococcus soli (ex Cha et al. 2016)]GGB65564.1 TldD protein [Deinococcus soli (ex Cha et al. 2016)]